MNGEKIVILICFIMLVAVVVFRVSPRVIPVDIIDAPALDEVAIDPLEQDVRTSQTAQGARRGKNTFMRFNTPWLFTPPWGNILPSKVNPRNATSVVIEQPFCIGEALVS